MTIKLTKRENVIVLLIAEGLTDKEIAQRLKLSTATVSAVAYRILKKLGVHSRSKIITSRWKLEIEQLEAKIRRLEAKVSL